MSKRKSNARSYQTQTGVSTAASPGALGRLVTAVVRAHPNVRIWLFRGPLGSGKTTAIRAILRARGVRRHVVSPTYTLAQFYSLPRQRGALHIDAYRVKHRREWGALGLAEARHDPGVFTLVEWPERLRGWPWGARGEFKLSIVPAGRRVTWNLYLQPDRLRRRRRRR